MDYRLREFIVKLGRHSLLLFWGAFSLVPLLWMISMSFQNVGAHVDSAPVLLPTNPTLVNYTDIFGGEQIAITRWFLNSLLIATIVTLSNLLCGSLAGYAFAKKNFFGKRFLFWVVITSMMIPAQVMLIPLYVIMVKLGLLASTSGRYLAICLPSLSAAFSIFLMKQFIQTMSTELEDAARIDGCSEMGVFFRIILPLSKPALAVLGIFTFMAMWNDFVWPLIVVNNSSTTLQVGLASLQSFVSNDIGIQMAGATISAIPMVIVFLSFQKYFIQGLRLGSVKG
jgi:multiple sugar transport system permease protein